MSSPAKPPPLILGPAFGDNPPPELSLDSMPDILENNMIGSNEQDNTETMQPPIYRHLSDQRFDNPLSPQEYNNSYSPRYNDIRNNPGSVLGTLNRGDSQSDMSESELTNFNNPNAADISNQADAPKRLPSQKRK
jgi:hypothetical protein